MATRTNWKELYQDLPEKVAALLREKRVKPEQLTAKTDGEILALGISDTDLETVRAKYAPLILDLTTKQSEPKTQTDGASIKTGSHFHKFPRQIHGRSQRYKILAKKLQSVKTYPPQKAVETIVSVAAKNKSIDLHINVTETGLRGEIKIPFSTGKTVRIEVFSDQTITALNNNTYHFDVLLATPADMPKLAKYAKVLGPKGLMPNPKNGTVTTDPVSRAKQMSSGASLAYKTEPKAPIIQLSLGKVSQKTEEITENLTTILREIGFSKIKSAYLTSTQTPSVRLDLSIL